MTADPGVEAAARKLHELECREAAAVSGNTVSMQRIVRHWDGYPASIREGYLEIAREVIAAYEAAREAA